VCASCVYSIHNEQDVRHGYAGQQVHDEKILHVVPGYLARPRLQVANFGDEGRAEIDADIDDKIQVDEDVEPKMPRAHYDSEIEADLHWHRDGDVG
jgi:hypothetical protein